ncbi:MAG: hypothetical protein NVSMB9_25370 [Isosphaeraceae bacterium]
MFATFFLPLLWGQMFLQGVPERLRPLIAWLFILGEPTLTIPGLLGGLMTWVKIISLFCLLGWSASWVVAALKRRSVARGSWLDIAALCAIVGVVGTFLLWVLQTTERIKIYKIAGIYTVNLLSVVCGVVLFLWVEKAIWSAIRRDGRRSDLGVLLGIHAVLAVGLLLGFVFRSATNRMTQANAMQEVPWIEALTLGVRLSATFMGYVVLFRVSLNVLSEILAVRFRRIYSIALLSIIESTRRMWAPWVVITVFLVILAFTHWFLQPPRAAEVGRLFVGTLTLLCSLLLTVMVTLLTPLSLPQDIQNQTIYTVVSKPVRRIELIWGRILGFMTIVTFLVLVFGGVSLLYLKRTVGGTIYATEQLAVKAAGQNRLTEARQLREQAEQIRTRMAARVPVFGSLAFLDSKGNPHLRGIDVGQEQSMREPRSHIEGATPASAIWTYGIVRDPFQTANGQPVYLDRRIPVDLFLGKETVEGRQNQVLELKAEIARLDQKTTEGNAATGKIKDLTAQRTRDQEELQRATEAYERLKAQSDRLKAEAIEAEKADNLSEAQSLRARDSLLHSPPIAMEMTFNVYRTTKGRIGEAVYAELEATNPVTQDTERSIFPIREYYTNKLAVRSSLLAGSQGNLRVEVRCISPTQYLGMAESDLFLLARSGDFGTNFMKGLFGVWLQAMVLTAIGVFAGTFLSWPVALLTTISFFVAGQVAFTFLLDFTRQSMLGGGPFESLIRLLSHDNQMSDLTPTLPVVVAKTFDALVMPLMSRLVYIVPNFSALDVSNTVADGFAVSWGLIGSNTFLAFAYALPFSIAGYFILKNREVAA